MKVEGVCGFSPFAPVTTTRCCRCPVGLKPSSWFLKGHFGRFSLFEVGKSWESFFFSWKRGENRCGQGRGILTFQSRELASRMLRSLTFLVRDQIRPEDLRNVLVLEVIERVCAETHPCDTTQVTLTGRKRMQLSKSASWGKCCRFHVVGKRYIRNAPTSLWLLPFCGSLMSWEVTGVCSVF